MRVVLLLDEGKCMVCVGGIGVFCVMVGFGRISLGLVSSSKKMKKNYCNMVCCGGFVRVVFGVVCDRRVVMVWLVLFLCCRFIRCVLIWCVFG